MSVSGAAGGSQIRRHHTISITPGRANSTSRTGVISEEPQEGQGGPEWSEDDDDVVPEDWTAPAIGPVGDGSSGLHRQASLPTAYHNREVHRVRSAAHMATRMNSLSAIEAEHVGEAGQEEDDWEKEMPWNRDEVSDTQQLSSPNVTRIHTSSSVSSLNGPTSPIYTPPQTQSPPPASSGANVRRHTSLTYGPATGGASKLSRTLTATANKRGGPAQNAAPGVLALGVPPPPPREVSPIMHEEDDEGSLPSSPVARAIGLGDGRASSSHQQHASGLPAGNDWRESTIDDVQRALGALEMQTSSSNHSIGGGRGASGSISSIGRPMGSPSASTPPRYVQSPKLSGTPRGAPQHGSYFPPSSYTSSSAAAVSQRATGAPSGGYGRRASSPGVAPGTGMPRADRREPVTSPGGGYNPGGPPSRSNSMPAWDIPSAVGRPRGDSSASGGSIGFAGLNNNNAGGSGVQNSNHSQQSNSNPSFGPYSDAYLNSGAGTYDPNTPQSTMMMPNSPYGGVVGLAAAGGPVDVYGNTYGGVYGGLAPQQHASPQQHLSMPTPRPTHIQMTPMASNTQLSGNGMPTPGPLDSPEIRTLVAGKGYNPPNIDTQPKNARFFVIKSYTEEDVHKSLKYEIWSSTDPGNKRLDKAFRENGGCGPIYLFFSVNTSGHFCGMAEMLTPLDYSRTSTVWAQDKWKGVFKVRWIFVKDIPNAILRGIKLENTQERKPVTNSRDTQELLPDAGNEMIRIFLTHEAKTSLLQDYAYYDVLAMQKANAAPSSPDAPTQAHVPGPPQRLLQQRQQQQQHQQPQHQHQQLASQGLPQLAPGTNNMYTVTPQQYQLLQQTQYALASVRNIQEQLAQQQLQVQQPQQSLPSGRLGGDQYANVTPSGMPQPQPPQRPSTHRQGSGSGRGYY